MIVYFPFYHTGIIGTPYSDDWKKQRHIAVGILRNLGYGKNVMESRILEEAEYLVKAFHQQGGKSFDGCDHIANGIANLICYLLFGHRYSYGDEQFQIVRHTLDHAFTLLIKDLPLDRMWFSKFKPGHQQISEDLKADFKIIHEFVHKKIEEKKLELNGGRFVPITNCNLIIGEKRYNLHASGEIILKDLLAA